MIDTQFTTATEIQVDLSIMPGEDKLILAYAAGEAPDAALSVNWTKPFDLDIHGTLAGLAQFEDFCDWRGIFSSSLLTHYILNDGVYALPETVYACVMYCRQDILPEP